MRTLRAQVIREESTCWLCGKPVDPTLQWPEPDSPSIDHVIPISSGGSQLDRENVRLAHLKCNLEKQDKILL